MRTGYYDDVATEKPAVERGLELVAADGEEIVGRVYECRCYERAV